MNRDYEQFPDDENGSALWNMVQQGDDLSKQRDVEFTVIFSTEDEALKFGAILFVNRQQVLLCDNHESDEYPYEVVATITMAPNHQEITDYEGLLEQCATDLNGANDGWGCESQS